MTRSKTKQPDAQPKTERQAIIVKGARTHNLKGVDCRIPHGALTVVTGPSGAGKSSLAFDTVFAEGQRRFVESMSTYARQFLDQMERPPVDSVDNVLPPVALAASNSIKNARSTVGTITEANDVLRLLFTHLGEMRCPRGHGAVRSSTSEEASALLAGGEVGERFTLVARVRRPAKEADRALGELVRQGFGRRLDGDEVVRMEPGSRWLKKLDPLPLVLGRFRAKGEVGMQLGTAVEEAYRLGEGRLEARGEDGTVRYYSREVICPLCATTLRRPTPALFSFNSPLGACSECQGFGRVVGVDKARVIPDPRRSLAERPIAAWNTPAFEDRYERLLVAAQERGISLDTPWEELAEEDRQWVWSGRGKFVSLDRFFAWLERRTYRVHVRVMLARYRSYTPCSECGGTRLQPDALAVRLSRRTLPELTAMSIEEIRNWLAEQPWSERQREVAGHLLETLGERIEVLHRVGLDYLTLDRQARTLSGGEAQRIHLAASLGSGLTSTLYVLDEPTIGLHPVDSAKLLELLHDLARRGNTVLVVEHDRTLILGADHIIDLGPAAGEYGGQVMAAGTAAEILASPESITGRALKQRPTRTSPAGAKPEDGAQVDGVALAKRPRISIRGARAHNLKNIDVELPMASLVAITGVSGSGKSTLIENVLYGTYQRAKGVVDVEPGECDALLGLESLADVTLVDQRPLGRSSRSNPVTYIKAYDEIRKLYAATPVARAAGIAAGHFSFNIERGRCPECQGTGVTEVDMQFMAPVSVTCERCQGRRFKPEVLAVRVDGRTIAEALELTVDEAIEAFPDRRRLRRRLELLADVGLGYLRLGQPTSTLSGGEAQRLKLASFLDRPKKEEPRLFLFDEPTTGLHMVDIDRLYQTLRRLVARGDGVVVVEHSTDLIARADWIVDLGPGGGVHGGQVLFAGAFEDFVEHGKGPTADELRSFLHQPMASGA